VNVYDEANLYCAAFALRGVAHQGDRPWPTVKLSPEVENDGLNYYVFLTPSR